MKDLITMSANKRRTELFARTFGKKIVSTASVPFFINIIL